MIARLTGTIAHIDTAHLVLDVNGVGYLVQAAGPTLAQLGTGQTASLFIEMQVRENDIQLFGFTEGYEQSWFRLLQSVQGVGAKVALAILGILPPDALQLAIAAQDKVQLTRADGVGPKLALRIMTELKDKAAAPAFTMAPNLSKATAVLTPVTTTAQDAISALANLGYGRSEAMTAVARASANLGNDAALDSLIKAGLQELVA